ncbi:MAG: hypothetical protein ACPL6C_00550, partial [bacterium]
MKHVSVIIFLITSTILAQVETQPIYFTSDEDIWASYYRGELTYEQTIELVDMYETKVEINSDDLSRLLLIPGFDNEDLNYLENLRAIKGGWKSLNAFEKDYNRDFELILPFIRVTPLLPRPISGEFYFYNYSKFKNLGEGIVTIDTVDEYGQYYTIIDTITTYYPPRNSFSLKLTSKKYGNFNSYFEQSGNNSIICKRRSYNISIWKGFFVLGNFNYSFGEGVLVGRYPTIPSSMRNHIELKEGKADDKI